jgi:hypothetical protein
VSLPDPGSSLSQQQGSERGSGGDNSSSDNGSSGTGKKFKSHTVDKDIRHTTSYYKDTTQTTESKKESSSISGA